MRSLFIVFLLVGVSHGFFGTINQLIGDIGGNLQSITNQIGQTASNLWNSVPDNVADVHSQLVNTATGVRFASNFLWDNVFSPAYDKIDHHLTVPHNALSDKHAELVARLKSNIHHLYENLFLMEQESLVDLQKGEHNLKDKIQAFYDKIDAIHKQINEWATETKYELEMHALTVQGDWVNILNQYNQTIDLSVQTITTLFQKLTQDLMKNLLQVALGAVPNASNIIENMKKQGLLSFFKQ